MKNPLESPSKKTIGERVRGLRVRRGKTQVELAKQLGMNQSNLSEVERGVRGLTIQQLMKLSKALSASSDEILFGSSSKREADHLS
ncbi:MAG: helix-turn-helix domain-containing protein, partial [Vicinamibacteria bacterium]